VEYGPAFGLVVGIDFPVPLPIPLDFGNPEVLVGFDGGLSVFPIMPMPECPIHKNHQFVFDQADIGFAGEFLFVAFVPDACMPQGFFEEFFRLGVFALDPGHVE